MPKLSELNSDDIQVVSTPGPSLAANVNSKADAGLKLSDLGSLKDGDVKIVSLPTKKETPGLVENGVGGLMALVGGGGESIGARVPIVGPLGRDLGEGFRAAVDYAREGGKRPYTEVFKGIHAANDADQARFAEEHPGANATRSVAGAIGALSIPIPGAQMTGIPGAAVRVGGAITGAGTDTLLRTGDPDKVRQAATVGGLIQSGIEAIPLVGKVAAVARGKGALTEATEAAAEKAGTFADERALKAATGQNKRALKEIYKTKGIEETGNLLRTSNEFAPEPVVQFGSSQNTVKDRAAKAAEAAWNKVTSIYKAVDQAAGGAAIDGKSIADAIRQRAAGIEPLAKNQGVLNSLEAEAAAIEKMGPMSLERAQELKNNFVFKFANPQTHSLGLDGNNAIREAFTETIGDTIRKADPNLGSHWETAMDAYGKFASTAGAASDRAVANISNRLISPSDYAMGATGALLSNVGKSGDASAIAQGTIGTAVALAHKVVRQRGSAMSSAASGKLAEILSASPETAAAVMSSLQNEPAALSAVHALMTDAQEPSLNQVKPQPRSSPTNLPIATPKSDHDHKRDAIRRRLGE